MYVFFHDNRNNLEFSAVQHSLLSVVWGGSIAGEVREVLGGGGTAGRGCVPPRGGRYLDVCTLSKTGGLSQRRTERKEMFFKPLIWLA